MKFASFRALLSLNFLAYVVSFNKFPGTTTNLHLRSPKRLDYPCLIAKSSLTTSLDSTSGSDPLFSDQLKVNDPPRAVYLTLWIALAVYAFGLAPGGSSEAAARDTELIKQLILTPYNGHSNAIFVAIFNFLGIVPAVFAGLFLPGAKKQKLPTALFSVSMLALGYFAAGPYLAFRNINTDVTETTRGKGSGLFESRIPWIASLVFASYLTYFAISQMSLHGVVEVWTEFLQLCSTSRLALISTIDLTILSLAVQEPIYEDMARRYKNGTQPPFPSWGYALLPVIGPVLYMLSRPALPKDE